MSSIYLNSESKASELTENSSRSSFAGTESSVSASFSEDVSEDDNDNVLFVREKPAMSKIELGGWKNASLNDNSYLSEESGNEDPVKESFASIDHAEMVRMRFEARQNDPPRVVKQPTIVQTSTLLSQISESPYSLEPKENQTRIQSPVQHEKPLKIDKVVEIPYPKGQKPLAHLGRKPVIPIQDPKEFLFDQGSKFSRKVECESEAKANFFSKKNAKRKRSEFASPQCEKMRSEPFSKKMRKKCENPIKNAKILRKKNS